MSRKKCVNCGRPSLVCFCHLIAPINNYFPVRIIQHVKEAGHSIGTAKIAQLGLTNCCADVIEDQQVYMSPFGAELPSSNAILVYPREDSLPVSEVEAELTGDGPVTLMFIDASWRKSKKVLHQSEYLQSLPAMSFTLEHESRYRIRKEPKPGYCSTLEAIVKVLQTLEHNTDKYLPLLAVMDWMIAKQVECMGEETFQNNYLSKNKAP